MNSSMKKINPSSQHKSLMRVNPQNTIVNAVKRLKTSSGNNHMRRNNSSYKSDFSASPETKKKTMFFKSMSFSSHFKKHKTKVFKRKANCLWVTFFIKKFVSILKISFALRKLRELSDGHYHVLNDQACFKDQLIDLKRIILLNNPYNELLQKTLSFRISNFFQSFERL